MLELWIGRKQRRNVALPNPGDLALLADDIAEEDGAQLRQTISRRYEGLDHRGGRFIHSGAQQPPIADNDPGNLVRRRVVEKGREFIRPPAPFLRLFIREPQSVKCAFRVLYS